MVIGSVLLQPQRLERAGHISSDDAVLHDLLSLAVCLSVDGAQDGRIVETLRESLEGTVTRLATRAGAGSNSAVTRFRALLVPLVAPIQTAFAQPPGEVEALFDGLEQGVTRVVNTLKNLTPEQMRQSMGTIFDILETDLGITPTFIRDAVLGVFDDMILALGIVPSDEAPDARAQRRTVAALLSRLKRFIRAHFTFPALHADTAAQALLALRRRPEVDEALTRAVCSGEAAVAYLRAGNALLDLLPYSPFPPFGEGSVGAAAAPPARDEFSLYASKLLEYDNYDGDLGELPLSFQDSLADGPVSTPLREAFLHASVVLARPAFLYTVDADKKWRVVDRKQYVIRKVASSLWVYRQFEIGLNDFLKANEGDQSKLRKLFRENGILVLPSSSLTVVHLDGSNTWDIDAGGLSFTGTTFAGNITIRPATLAGLLFQLPATLQPALHEEAPAPALRQAFESQGIPLSPRCKLSIRDPENEWLLADGEFEYTIKKGKDKFEISTGGFWGWLRSTISKPKGDMVWVNRERTQVLLGQRIMHTGSNLSWADAPIFKPLNGNRHYSLLNTAETVEGWAYHASWVQDAVNIILYAIKIGVSIDQDEVQYSIASNSLTTGRLLSEMIVKLAQHRQVAALVGSDFVYDLLLDIGIILVKGIEALVKPSAPSPPTTANDFSQAVDAILSALVGVEIVDTHWSALLYEFTLSCLTLVNHQEPTQATQRRPENYKQNGGFVDLFWKSGLLVYTAAIPDSEYALPFQTASLTAGYWLGGALGIGLVMGFVGLLVGQGAVARAPVFADTGHVLKTLSKSTGKSLLYFWPYLKLAKGKL